MAGLVKVACVVVMCVALVGAPLAEAITCGLVTSNLAPCLAYIQTGAPPSPGCCNGIRSIIQAASTTADKQTVCNCLKSSAGQAPGYNDRNARAIPGACGINVPYFSTSTNCARIRF
ncbi:hypothetical protein QN277_011986 [Acacia crassicarpa]|uniref:Non-specific lipid-transfer protein n=1 Tax=Acacia crassicarpa TaxID=499986 RepID=A0AAE1TCY2_9FABA|nr:hypothetical protein QN277_011986 [Acacia crassicarpa]